MHKILLVEDDDLMINLYTSLLSSKNFDVAIAKNGEECLKALAKEIPSLIILDTMMPKVDGLTALSDIKMQDAYKNIPIIMLSNLSNEDVMSQAFALGVTNYFVKSDVTNEELITTIRNILKDK